MMHTIQSVKSEFIFFHFLNANISKTTEATKLKFTPKMDQG